MYFCEIRIIHYHLKPGITFRNHECIYPDITDPDAVFRPSPASDVYVWVPHRFPIPQNGILKLSLCAHQNFAQRCGQEQATYQCPAVFLVSPQSAPKPASGAFSMQMSGVGLKNGVPYLQMGLSTLASHVSRRLEDQRTSINQSIPRRIFFLIWLATIALPVICMQNAK